MSYAVAVIDIGMTNKKVAVYDENLHQLDAVYKTFEPLKVRELDTGIQVEAHDLAGMEDWFFEQLRIFAQKYPIKALSVTTHGAIFTRTSRANNSKTNFIKNAEAKPTCSAARIRRPSGRS